MNVRPATFARAAVVLTLGSLATFGCVAPPPTGGTRGPSVPVGGEVTLISPRCVGAKSCVLGHVTAAENGAPLSRAAVFLEPLGQAAPDPDQTILALTDDQGVFTVIDPPPGDYRLAVYAQSRKAEVKGLRIENSGTTMVPIRLVPGAI